MRYIMMMMMQLQLWMVETIVDFVPSILGEKRS